MYKELSYNRSWKDVFKNAIDGCRFAFLTQKNFVIHSIFSLTAIALGIWLEIDFVRFLFLILVIIIGFTAEMANTAIEKTVDLITEERNPKAKIAKDVSAGMVLVAAVGLVIVGSIILFPPLWQKISAL